MDLINERRLRRQSRMHKRRANCVRHENVQLDVFGTGRGEFDPIAAFGCGIIFPMQNNIIAIGQRRSEFAWRREGRNIFAGIRS